MEILKEIKWGAEMEFNRSTLTKSSGQEGH
jgi:hypothetical protein